MKNKILKTFTAISNTLKRSNFGIFSAGGNIFICTFLRMPPLLFPDLEQGGGAFLTETDSQGVLKLQNHVQEIDYKTCIDCFLFQMQQQISLQDLCEEIRREESFTIAQAQEFVWVSDQTLGTQLYPPRSC